MLSPATQAQKALREATGGSPDASAVLAFLWEVQETMGVIHHCDVRWVGTQTGMGRNRAERAARVLRDVGLYRWTQVSLRVWRRQLATVPEQFGPLPDASRQARPPVPTGRDINRYSVLSVKGSIPPTPHGGVAGVPPRGKEPTRPAAARPPGRRALRRPRLAAVDVPEQAHVFAAAVGLPEAAGLFAHVWDTGWTVGTLHGAWEALRLPPLRECTNPWGAAKWRLDTIMATQRAPAAPRQRVRDLPPHCGDRLCRAGSRVRYDYETNLPVGDCPACSPYVMAQDCPA